MVQKLYLILALNRSTHVNAIWLLAPSKLMSHIPTLFKTIFKQIQGKKIMGHKVQVNLFGYNY